MLGDRAWWVERAQRAEELALAGVGRRRSGGWLGTTQPGERRTNSGARADGREQDGEACWTSTVAGFGRTELRVSW